MTIVARMILLPGLLLVMPVNGVFAQVSISADNSSPDPSAMLDVKSSAKGVLLPNVALTGINTADPVISPATGLLVYNTVAAGAYPDNVVPGYYYWNGTSWISVASPQGISPGDMLYWSGTQWIRLPAGSPGQFLQLSPAGIPVWSGYAYATLATESVSGITSASAISGGNIDGDGGAEVTERGVCWSTSSGPTTDGDHSSDGSGTGTFSSNLTGLTGGTVYYVRAYATNSVGTAYGNEIRFSTSVSDYDGNIYRTVIIGTQVWMAENLKTTRFNDGTPVPLVTGGAAWAGLTTPGYCWYLNNEAGYGVPYGALYNWYSVVAGNLCPSGWHVPDDSEWVLLASYLGGSEIAGGKLKEAGTAHFLAPNAGATNETGFTALPGSIRNYLGNFELSITYYGYYWSTTESSSTIAWTRSFSYADAVMHRDEGNYPKKDGCSVRCLKY